MTTVAQIVFGIAISMVVWVLSAVVYRWVWKRPLRWWAIPFATGCLLFGVHYEDWEKAMESER